MLLDVSIVDGRLELVGGKALHRVGRGASLFAGLTPVDAKGLAFLKRGNNGLCCSSKEALVARLSTIFFLLKVIALCDCFKITNLYGQMETSRSLQHLIVIRVTHLQWFDVTFSDDDIVALFLLVVVTMFK